MASEPLITLIVPVPALGDVLIGSVLFANVVLVASIVPSLVEP